MPAPNSKPPIGSYLRGDNRSVHAKIPWGGGEGALHCNYIIGLSFLESKEVVMSFVCFGKIRVICFHDSELCGS